MKPWIKFGLQNYVMAGLPQLFVVGLSSMVTIPGPYFWWATGGLNVFIAIVSFGIPYLTRKK